MSVKTKIKKQKLKNLKEQIKLFFTKKRYIKSYKKKKVILIIFLFIVNSYIWNNVINQLKVDWRVTITAVAEEEVETNGSASAIASHDTTAMVEVEKNDAKPSGVAPSGDIEEKIKRTFPEEPETMLAIAKAESRLKPDAVNINRNGTKDCGIFQINSIHGYDCKWLKDIDNNIKVAREVYDKQGKTAWVTYNYSVENNKPI